MRIVSVVGTRPQFVKLAPIAKEFVQNAHVQHSIVDTGQHYDPGLSSVFFEELHIPPPDAQLGIGSGSHAVQTASIMLALEGALEELAPDWVLVYGDTNSTIAATLTAIKMQLPVAHLEAGLRSFNRSMPEEHNRVLVDHAADLLLAPTDLAMTNLATEGLLGRSVNVGDVMTDVCLATRDYVAALPPTRLGDIDARSPYLIATVHRAENTDYSGRLNAIIEALRRLSLPVVLFAHPRLVARAKAFQIDLAGGAIHTLPPVGYHKMMRAVMGSVGVITDSGGLQKESYLLERTCTTLRTETEWPETLLDGWNILDPQLANLHELAVRPRPSSPQEQPYGDGHAAAKVLKELAHAQGSRRARTNRSPCDEAPPVPLGAQTIEAKPR